MSQHNERMLLHHRVESRWIREDQLRERPSNHCLISASRPTRCIGRLNFKHMLKPYYPSARSGKTRAEKGRARAGLVQTNAGRSLQQWIYVKSPVGRCRRGLQTRYLPASLSRAGCWALSRLGNVGGRWQATGRKLLVVEVVVQ